MDYKELYVFVEGDTDQVFFERVVTPRLACYYSHIRLIKYRNRTKSWLDNFIRSIRSMGAHYIFAVDINNSPCATVKKRALLDRYNHLEEDRIIVVVKEIESWYIAGLGASFLKEYRMKPIAATDTFTKEDLINIMPERFRGSWFDFIYEILKGYSIDSAIQNNQSFYYFMEKYIRPILVSSDAATTHETKE